MDGWWLDGDWWTVMDGRVDRLLVQWNVRERTDRHRWRLPFGLVAFPVWLRCVPSCGRCAGRFYMDVEDQALPRGLGVEHICCQ